MAREISAAIAATDLHELTRALDPKDLKRALRYTLQDGARKLKRYAVQEIKATGIHNGQKVGSKLAGSVNYRMDGLYVAARAHGDRYMHMTRAGKLKPISFWWAVGTTDRKTSWHKLNRGSTPSHDYLDRARTRGVPEVSKDIDKTFDRKVRLIADKIFG